MKTTIISAVKKAGKYVEKYFNKKHKVKSKSRNDIVTQTDINSEKIIISEIKKKYPDHQILSEEVGRIGGKNDYLWIIDPVDATINFASGIPLYSVSIGLLHKGEIEYAVVYAPSLNEMFYAQKNKGAFLNNKKIKASKEKKLKSTIINIGTSAHYSKKQIKNNFQIANKIMPEIRGLRAFESGALTSCYIACGRLDGKVSIKTDPFGNAASTLIIEEAGGKVTDFSGNNWSEKMKTMICSNKLIHNQLMEYTKIII